MPPSLLQIILQVRTFLKPMMAKPTASFGNFEDQSNLIGQPLKWKEKIFGNIGWIIYQADYSQNLEIR